MRISRMIVACDPAASEEFATGFARCGSEIPKMKRPFSNSRVDRAGKILTGRLSCPDGQDGEKMYGDAFQVLSEWRAFHAFALDAISETLTNRARVIDPRATIAQRLKRF